MRAAGSAGHAGDMPYRPRLRRLALVAYLLVVAGAFSVFVWSVVRDGPDAPSFAGIWPMLATAPASFVVVPAWTYLGSPLLDLLPQAGEHARAVRQVVDIGVCTAVSAAADIALVRAVVDSTQHPVPARSRVQADAATRARS